MRYMHELNIFLLHLFQSRQIFVSLVKNDFKKQYLGSYLGVFWAFAQPITYIAVIWTVFTFGFRNVTSLGSTPFFIWLLSGMIPWFFFSSAFINSSNAIVSNSYLVKKVAFRVSILPLVQIFSALMIHLVLLFTFILVLCFYGFMPDIFWIQIFYYIFCTLFFLFGLSLITSSIRVFVKDIGNLISIMIQIGFWATPIFWNVKQVPEKYQYLINLNPVHYIINGYRDTFINHVWFYERPYESLYFLTLSSVLFILGAMIFRKLRPHFGNVL